jgi:hypothetical protein
VSNTIAGKLKPFALPDFDRFQTHESSPAGLDVHRGGTIRT